VHPAEVVAHLVLAQPVEVGAHRGSDRPLLAEANADPGRPDQRVDLGHPGVDDQTVVPEHDVDGLGQAERIADSHLQRADPVDAPPVGGQLVTVAGRLARPQRGDEKPRRAGRRAAQVVGAGERHGIDRREDRGALARSVGHPQPGQRGPGSGHHPVRLQLPRGLQAYRAGPHLQQGHGHGHERGGGEDGELDDTEDPGGHQQAQSGTEEQPTPGCEWHIFLNPRT
jgi:hypothetical protein